MATMSVLRWLSATLVSLLCLCAFAHARVNQKAKDEPAPDVPMQQWLAAPDHSDFPAQYKVMPPRLTYLQRYLVETRVAISGEIARGRDLHIWLKVADNTGKWIPGEAHVHSEASTALSKKNEFQFVAGFYASPGQYTVAVVIYDVKSEKYNVRHLPLKVEPLKNDPLDGHEESSGTSVEFLSDPPPGMRSFQDISSVSKYEPDSLWPFAAKLDSYPLNSTRPVQLDVVLNFSDPGDTFTIPPSVFSRARRSIFDSMPETVQMSTTPGKIQLRQKEYIGAVLSVGQVLAAIHPANGCVRISGIDMTGMEVAFRRSAPESIEWEALRKTRSTTKLAEVSVHALQNRKEQPMFLRDFLTNLQEPIANCGSGADPLHEVIFVSHAFAFPVGAHKEDFHITDHANFRIHYYQLNTGPRANYDDLGSFLKSADTKSHDVFEPKQLREAMARTFADIASRTSKK